MRASRPVRTSPSPILSTLQPFVTDGLVVGAVTLVADREGILSLDCVGFADRARRRPMRSDTLFWIASQSKPMTAAAFMMLVDEGKVGLDDPVERFLPEFTGQWLAAEREKDRVLLRKPGHPITIREVLSHTSGLPFSSAMEQPTLDLLPLRTSAASYAMTPLDFQPGTRYQYSNAGINTAGRIIEVITGIPFEQFLDGRLLKPLGMKDTTFWPDARQLARLAVSYQPAPGGKVLEEATITQLRYPLNDRTRQPMPAGGLFSTAADVSRFYRMVLRRGELDGRRLLSESAVREMTRRQTPTQLPDSYGLGWRVTTDGFGHGGAYSTDTAVYPSRGLVLVWLVQHVAYLAGGEKCYPAFTAAALDAFGGSHGAEGARP